jgi:hypothetical protein
VERASFAGCVLNLLQAFSGDEQLVVAAGMGLGMIPCMNFLSPSYRVCGRTIG